MTLAVTKGASLGVQTEPLLKTGRTRAGIEEANVFEGRPAPDAVAQVEHAEKYRVFSEARSRASEDGIPCSKALEK